MDRSGVNEQSAEDVLCLACNMGVGWRERRGEREAGRGGGKQEAEEALLSAHVHLAKY